MTAVPQSDNSRTFASDPSFASEMGCVVAAALSPHPTATQAADPANPPLYSKKGGQTQPDEIYKVRPLLLSCFLCARGDS